MIPFTWLSTNVLTVVWKDLCPLLNQHNLSRKKIISFHYAKQVKQTYVTMNGFGVECKQGVFANETISPAKEASARD